MPSPRPGRRRSEPQSRDGGIVVQASRLHVQSGRLHHHSIWWVMDMPQQRGDIHFVDPRTTPFVEMRCRGELPHLYKESGSYFVTFRLWDAVIPDEQRHRWREMQRIVVQASRPHAAASTAALPGPAILRLRELTRDLAQASEPPLQAGSCLLRAPEVAAIVQDTLLHFDQQRYQLAAWCVMPNHVHVAYSTIGTVTPDSIHHSWKSFTSHEVNRLLRHSGTLWERESFDHLIRSIDSYEVFIEYIEHNPCAAGLCRSPAEWPFSSAGRDWRG